MFQFCSQPSRIKHRKENGGVVSDNNSASPRFGIQTLENKDLEKKKKKREVEPQELGRV